jgi:predicted nucleic acid-binding protein
MNAVVSNASPLIVLAKAELLRIVPTLFSQVLAPQAVLDEIEAGPVGDPLKLALPSCSWLVAVRLEPPISPLAVWQSGRGEAEVIEYARLHGNLPVLLDDRAARRAAEALGLQVHGTVGLVAAAAKKGVVASFPSAVAALRKAGLYVSDEIVEALEKALKSGKQAT